jgi:CubicO group peptidase (beta-lactamase class C family)
MRQSAASHYDMKRFPPAVLLLAAVVHLTLPPDPAAARGQIPGPASAALTELDKELAADFVRDAVGGASIGVVSGGSLVWSKHYGYADTEAKAVASNDTVYRVGSITKQLTGLALLQLVEQGKMPQAPYPFAKSRHAEAPVRRRARA